MSSTESKNALKEEYKRIIKVNIDDIIKTKEHSKKLMDVLSVLEKSIPNGSLEYKYSEKLKAILVKIQFIGEPLYLSFPTDVSASNLEVKILENIMTIIHRMKKIIDETRSHKEVMERFIKAIQEKKLLDGYVEIIFGKDTLKDEEKDLRNVKEPLLKDEEKDLRNVEEPLLKEKEIKEKRITPIPARAEKKEEKTIESKEELKEEYKRSKKANINDIINEIKDRTNEKENLKRLADVLSVLQETIPDNSWRYRYSEEFKTIIVKIKFITGTLYLNFPINRSASRLEAKITENIVEIITRMKEVETKIKSNEEKTEKFLEIIKNKGFLQDLFKYANLGGKELTPEEKEEIERTLATEGINSAAPAVIVPPKEVKKEEKKEEKKVKKEEKKELPKNLKSTSKTPRKSDESYDSDTSIKGEVKF